MPASSAEQLLGSQFHEYAHKRSGHKAHRSSTNLNVPAEIGERSFCLSTTSALLIVARLSASKLDFIGGANTPIHK